MAEKMVILKNVGDVPLQVSLFHHLVCAHRQVCTCETVQEPGRPPLHNPASVRLPIGEASVPLPAAVKLIPQVKSAVAKGLMTISAAPVKVEVR